MKKTFLARRNALFSSASASWGAIALVGVLFLLLIRLFAPNFFLWAFTPVFHTADAFREARHTFLQSFKDTAELSLHNEKLLNENSALANENQALRQEIKSILGLESDERGIIARVVARPPSSPYDTLVLNEGSQAGIALGMEVFGESGVPLGTVSSVLADFSRVTLFSSPHMTLNGWVRRASMSEQTDIPIIIQGAGAGALNASAPRSADITAGDKIFAPGPGIVPIGTVIRVDSEQSSASVTLRIMPTVNIFSISWVVVRDTSIFLP